jgi:hypothetical protein
VLVQNRKAGEMKINNMKSNPDILNLPINREICFSNHKGVFKEKIMEGQTKTLARFIPLLKPLLEPGEEILLSVEATSPMSFLEQWTTGWIIYYLKRCVLILTNRRILHFPTKYNFTPKYSLSQIRYGDIEEFKLSGFLGRVLKMEYKSGKKEKFYSIKLTEFKKLKALEPLLIKDQPSHVRERHFLCPRCLTPLVKDIFSCPNCCLEFKNMQEAIRLSLQFPGGGYFYTGHPVLGIMDAITEGILLLELIVSLFGALITMESWGFVLLFAVLLFYEKLITIYHGKHYISEYIPIDRNFGLFSFKPAQEAFSPYKPSPEQGQRKWLKTAFATIFLIFSMSFLTWELCPLLGCRYRAHQHPSSKGQYSTQYARRRVSVDPEKARLMAALLEARYTRIDDSEKWVPALYQQKDFAAIERQVVDLLQDRNDEAKAYQLYTLYNTLADVNHDKDIESKKSVLDEWCNKQPESHIPWLLRGIFYTNYAWHIRGGGWAKDVPKDAWPKFRAMLEKARTDLERSYQLNPSDPNSSCNLLIIARGLSYPREKMEEYFRNAISASLWHFGAHYHKLHYLMPKWHGTLKKMYDFTMQCMKFADEHPYMGLVAVAAFNEVHDRSSENENYLGRKDVWPIVEKIYNNFFEKYPEDIRRRFNYAYHAYKAEKYDVATKQFEMIGERWMKGTAWRSLERFNNCRAHAYAAYGITLPPDQAVTYLRRSLELNPAEKASYFNLGTFAAKLGQYEEAETAFLKAIEFDPGDAQAHLRLSWIYGKTDNPAKAKDHAEKALNCNPTEQQKNLAKCYIDSFNKALQQK